VALCAIVSGESELWLDPFLTGAIDVYGGDFLTQERSARA
jgi:hypothetical protein